MDTPGTTAGPGVLGVVILARILGEGGREPGRGGGRVFGARGFRQDEPPEALLPERIDEEDW